MSKTRQEVKFLLRELNKQVRNIPHVCSIFSPDGRICQLCSLVGGGFNLAALALLRENHIYLDQWLPAERNIFELVGDTEYTRLVEKEVSEIKNAIRKQCSGCGNMTLVYQKPSRMAWRIANEVTYLYPCRICGNNIEIIADDLPDKLKLLVLKMRQKIKKDKKGEIELKNPFKKIVISANTSNFTAAGHDYFWEGFDPGHG